jgi:hypothetical protein
MVVAVVVVIIFVMDRFIRFLLLWHALSVLEVQVVCTGCHHLGHWHCFSASIHRMLLGRILVQRRPKDAVGSSTLWERRRRRRRSRGDAHSFACYFDWEVAFFKNLFGRGGGEIFGRSN